jgi:hypothetical protein
LDAAVLWDPEACPAVLRVHARSCAPDSASVRLDTFVGASTLVLEAGFQHLLLREDDLRLQLCAEGASLLEPARFLVEVPAGRARLAATLTGFRRLGHLATCGRLNPAQFPVDPRGTRLAFVLQALDGRLAGQSDRVIAEGLFGGDRVLADWNHPGQHLRDRVRRAVRRGQTLMKGGYRLLLR